jgi:hypothetical protein
VSVYKFSAPGTLKTGRTVYTSMLAGNPTYNPKEFMVLSYTGSPYISVWNISNATFGTKVTDWSLPSGVTGTNQPSWSRTGASIVVPTGNSSPFIHGYRWTAGASPAWGTKFSDPSTLPTGNTSFATFSNNDLIVATATSPFVLAYQYSDTTGFGTKYANPATLPPAAAGGALSDDGTTFVGSFDSSPYVHAYAYTNGTGFGAKYSDPATLPGGPSGAGNWNRASSAYAIPFTFSGINGTQGVWKWSSGWSTKYSDPSPSVLNYYGSQQLKFNHNDTALGWAQYSQVSGQKIQAYAWNNTTGYGSKYAQPAAGDVNDGRGFSFNHDSTAISYSSNTSPSVHLWAFSTSTGYGTKSADPATLPSGLGNYQQMRLI